MAATPKQKRKVARVMREFKEGQLSSKSGGKVKKRKQAIAIALSESGQSRNRPKARKMSAGGAKRGGRRKQRGAKK